MKLRQQNSLLFLVAVLAIAIFGVNSTAQQLASANVNAFLEARLASLKTAATPESGAASKFEQICPVATNTMAKRVFDEYGAVFVVKEPSKFPDRCVFNDTADVERFQRSLKTRSALIGGVAVELQEAAMDSLVEVQKDAEALGLHITPLDGAIAGKRSYNDTVRIWNTRFQRALDHWVQLGKISEDDAVAVRNMNIGQQVDRVIAWESAGLYFSTDFSRSIFSSTAPPGTSQHLAMLAIDIVEHNDPMVVSLLASRGWYRTVLNDATHFTFIGVPESELPNRGLKPVMRGGYKFWIPNNAPTSPGVTAMTEPGE
ncbi:MAG TPA: hypothetical protein VL325_00525 [Pyrinomonadaceae bacterium]|jgi:hypothetical protein|nr:hypothetical protein [Pyrinomonadaceae bacterium]